MAQSPSLKEKKKVNPSSELSTRDCSSPMEQLSRTVSAESSRSWTTQLLASGNGSSPASRKARSSEPETGGSNIERQSVSMPPPASKSVPIQFPSRRQSKASDTSLVESSGAGKNGSVIEETDTTPTLEGTRHGSLAGTHTLTLPDTAFYRSKPDADAESNRLSFSSLYSLGSVIMNTTRGLSGPSSVAGSEPEGMQP